METSDGMSVSPSQGVQSPRRSVLGTVVKVIGAIIVLLVLVGLYLWNYQQPHHSTPTIAANAVAASGNEVLDSIRKGVEYIRIHQEKDGQFSKGMLDPKPGFTALVVDSLARSPDKLREGTHPWIEKAAKAIVSYQNEDGSISSPAFGLDTYTTSTSILALTALENPAHAKVIQRAKDYLISVQYRDDEENANFGSPGYKKDGKTSGDLAATWVEALKEAGVKEGDPAFKNAEKFLSRLQNNSETNDKPAPGSEVGDDGGLFYRPGESKAPDEVGKTGKRVVKSYGLMSYAGLKSFLYMNINKDDPRVKSAFRWVRDNYTLEENRNIGPDGLYYYYLTMAKALSLYGEPVIKTSDGAEHNWAKELSAKLISLQRPDGSWANGQSGRWLESDAVMVSAFAIRTLTICNEELKNAKDVEKK
jgi:squalene-hopene/tetraprenyl-beta-curcumene cyclase